MSLTVSLDSLEHAQLVRRLDVPDLEYAFKHVLTHEAAYQSLLLRQRREIHRRVAEYYEALSGGDAEENAAVIAHHFAEAGDDEKTLHYATLAGDAATRMFANAEAIMHYTSALDAASHLSSPAASGLYRARGRAYETVGDFERAEADLQTALHLAAGMGDRHGEWQALIVLGQLWASRDYNKTNDFYQRALALARAMDDPATLAHSLNRVGNWYLNVEQPLEALRYHREALTIFERLNDRHGTADTLDFLGIASLRGGDFINGQAYYKRAIALFRELNERQGLASSLAVGEALMRIVQFSPATPVPISPDPTFGEHAGEEALRIARDIDYRAGEAFALLMLSMLPGAQGDYARAFQYSQASYDVAEAIEHRQWMCAAHFALGILYLDLLALLDAQQHLERSLALAREINSLIWINHATERLALTHISQNELEKAETLLNSLNIEMPGETVGQRAGWYTRAELALARGEPVVVLHIVDQLIASAGVGGSEYAMPHLAKLRGEALTMLGHLDEAEAALHRAEQDARQLSLRPLLWRIHVSLGKLYRCQQRHGEAERAFEAALAMVNELVANVPVGALRDTFLRNATGMIGQSRDERTPSGRSGGEPFAPTPATTTDV